jgi:DNA-binding transcriptional regulator GbsR (MarR family)
MADDLTTAREHFIQGLSRISQFWGFPRAMGAVYGAIYLSPTPLGLDDLVKQVGVSKGSVSTNVRLLERLGMVRKHIELGSRRDFYTAETDFWEIIKGILREREKSEFDLALQTVEESIDLITQVQHISSEDIKKAQFYEDRMRAMEDFFQVIDAIVASILKLENLVTVSNLLGLLKSQHEYGKNIR